MTFKIDQQRLNEMLRIELEEYEELHVMSEEERQALHDWVSEGHSVYENGWYFSQKSGAPMSFLDSYRHIQDELKNLEKGDEKHAQSKR